MYWPEGIIFDWDNTLVDSWGHDHYAINQTLKKFAAPAWSLSKTKEAFAIAPKNFFPLFFPDDPIKAEEIFFSFPFEPKPLPGIDMLLSSLCQYGIKLSVLSNTPGILLRQQVDSLGWRKYFHIIIGANDGPFDKPKPQSATPCLAAMNFPNHVWFIGDHPIDWECAFKINAIPICFGTPSGNLATGVRHIPSIQSWIEILLPQGAIK